MNIATAHPAAETDVAPAPWQLKGSAFVLVLKMPDEAVANCPWTPAALRDSRRSRLSFAMLVNYKDSPVGPYHELLFIPGTFAFQGGRYPSISRILVSTQASVDNGRRNWGIPKDRCDFRVEAQEQGVVVTELLRDDKTPFARLRLQGWGRTVPVATWLPRRLKALAQLWQGRQFVLSPSASGRMRMARVLDWQFDATEFPDLARGRCLMALEIPDFRMTFPEPEISRWTC